MNPATLVHSLELTTAQLLLFVAISASANRRAQNVGILPVIIPKLKLSNVHRQIFLADLVIAADDAAINQRQEALDCYWFE
jgi:hypothetical protein